MDSSGSEEEEEDEDEEEDEACVVGLFIEASDERANEELPDLAADVLLAGRAATTPTRGTQTAVRATPILFNHSS